VSSDKPPVFRDPGAVRPGHGRVLARDNCATSVSTSGTATSSASRASVSRSCADRSVMALASRSRRCRSASMRSARAVCPSVGVSRWMRCGEGDLGHGGGSADLRREQVALDEHGWNAVCRPHVVPAEVIALAGGKAHQCAAAHRRPRLSLAGEQAGRQGRHRLGRCGHAISPRSPGDRSHRPPDARRSRHGPTHSAR
jgi:hypothetical protein